ncbi:MAG: hypothetical protein JWN85_658 [Gammaproteobacteria bacterium]|nr:hypothetical protein [Gammaproteobacteria bacterium]
MSPQKAGWVLLLALLGSQGRASQVMPPRLYEITTETGMPHLEENLRYTTTHERRCVLNQELATAFPILSHPALRGCRLDGESRHDDTVLYALACRGGHGTTGNALWRVNDHQIRGTLNVKLGGKNMTFYQRVTARPVGGCPSRPD